MRTIRRNNFVSDMPECMLQTLQSLNDSLIIESILFMQRTAYLYSVKEFTLNFVHTIIHIKMVITFIVTI